MSLVSPLERIFKYEDKITYSKLLQILLERDLCK